jgi:hypothetical protein
MPRRYAEEGREIPRSPENFGAVRATRLGGGAGAGAAVYTIAE